MYRKLQLREAALLFLFAGCVSAAPLTYAVTDSKQFGTLDLSSGNFTQISSTADVLYGIVGVSGGFDALTSNGILVSINPSTGAETTIGDTTLGSNTNTFDSFAGTLYAIGVNGELYSINPATAALTTVGSTGIAPLNASDAYYTSLTGFNGSLYYTLEDVTTSVGPDLYKVNPATGASQFIGSTAGYLDASLYYNGVFYGLSSTDDPQGARIFSINPTSGQGSLLGDISGNATTVYGVTVVPEPATVVLLGAGLAALYFRSRPSLAARE